ncbi:MAG: Asp-tRNA(Asn)/Glu-tRNA(Gln) amidotransferase subunit GatA [Magnetococcales bacterium]|nr:Asp-tRNA(Asn)/Glu-tRNA(Gln) amidotransferase subunit GatA [Magnetococcales bacterium]
MFSDPTVLSISQLAESLKKRQISSEDLVNSFLERIERINPEVNAYITIDRAGAIKAAQDADNRLDAKQGGPLTGVPIGVKDLFCTKEVRTTCGSRMLHNFIPPYESTVTSRLKAAGAVMLGKTNMDEFAMGSSNETSFFGVVKNPWDLTRIPGGSSGGSAAAVSAGLGVAAIGTDTGGSIRQPAALTGITGIKPTYGRVSRFGMVAFASSLDQAGPMTKTAEDAALLLQAMAGHDPKDATSIDSPVPDYMASLNDGLKGRKIGVPEEYFATGLSTDVASVIEEAKKQFQDLGAELVPVSLPTTKQAIPTYYVLAPAEASSNLARYDGIRFGYRCENPQDIKDLFTRSRAEGFGSEVKRRIMLGTYVLSSGYYDAYYLKAQKVRRMIADDFKAAFTKVDLLLTPTTPDTAFKLGAKTDDPVQMYLSDIFTINVNLAGLPAISIPCGFSRDNLPIGLQLIGRPLDESGILSAAHAYQQATEWHTRKPVL